MTRHIFVIGLDDFHRGLLQTIRNAQEYEFHGLLDYDLVVNPESYSIKQMLTQARRELEPFQEIGIHAIIGHWDFPTTTLLAVLQREYGIRGPGLANVLIAENKYWCRQRQAQVVPEMVPAFQTLAPLSGKAEDMITLDFPYWIKPVIGFSSLMAYCVQNTVDLQHALTDIRERIHLFGDPFREFMQTVELPENIPSDIDAYHCIVEKPINGRQCTLEGYVRQRQAHVYAVIDSFREGLHHSCFSRYQYPSQLPQSVQEQMIVAACGVIEGLGLDETPFNMEFYWNEETGHIWLLEVNPRISKSHAPLFANVAGASHHEVAIDVALGREPGFPRFEGRYPLSAKFMLRRHRDGIVTRVPSSTELHSLHEAFPGTYIQIHVNEGDRLSDLRGQDSYSFEVAVIFTGAESEQEILEKERRIRSRLPIEFDDGAGLEVTE